jgi:hypothetical protein
MIERPRKPRGLSVLETLMEQTGESGNHIAAVIATMEEPTISISAEDHEKIRALLGVMEGRLETLERDLLNEFRKSLDGAKNLIADDISQLRRLTLTGTPAVKP